MLWGLNGTRHSAIETIISGCYGDEPGGSDFGWEGPVGFSVILEIFSGRRKNKKGGENTGGHAPPVELQFSVLSLDRRGSFRFCREFLFPSPTDAVLSVS